MIERINRLEMDSGHLRELLDHSNDGITKCFERIEYLEETIGALDHLARSAQAAESLFAQKVHDLKSIDKKRDDVINALCQKVEALSAKLDRLWAWKNPEVDCNVLLEKVISQL